MEICDSSTELAASHRIQDAMQNRQNGQIRTEFNDLALKILALHGSLVYNWHLSAYLFIHG